VLDVACATGYSSAVLARLANTVVSLESDKALSRYATDTLIGLGVENVAVVVGPLEHGWPAAAPYDVILIGGSIEAVPPALVDQLEVGGRLVTAMNRGPVSSGMLFVKTSHSFSGRPVFDAAVPRLPGFSTGRPSFSDQFFAGA
jgi:protein-L-isoaspartate(D-aspartate) O-methyltransferase